VRRVAPAAIVLLLGIVVIALSAGGPSGEEEVADTIKSFFRAAADGDGEAACEQLTPTARAPAGGLPCEAAIDQLGTLGGSTAKRRLSAVRVRRVRVRGNRATAEAQIPTQSPTTLYLARVERRLIPGTAAVPEWKIHSVGMPGGGAL
jgi:hypothetical protein